MQQKNDQRNKIGNTVHLLYMDDLKLFAPNDEKLSDQLKLVKQYSEDIQMEFGLDKCAKCTFMQGKNQKNRHLNR